MSFSDQEFDAILNDRTKGIDGDIVWSEDEDHSPSRTFRVEITSGGGWPLLLQGSFNPLIDAVSYTMFSKAVGRIYALDIGKQHRNPDRQMVGETHKHRWSEQHKDREGYCPPDITADGRDPVGVWQQFCEEAGITHRGRMLSPPPVQGDLFI